MEQGAQFVYLLTHSSSIMMRQADQVLQERLGLGLSQLRILTMLEHQPHVRQRRLADSLGQTEASISRQIKLLSEKGFLSVSISPKSRREHLALLTPKAIKITQAAKEVLEVHYRPLVESLGGKQLEKITNSLVKIHSQVCAPGQPFGCDHPFEPKADG